MLAGAVSLFAGVFLVFFLEYLANLKEPEARIQEIQEEKGQVGRET